MLKSFKNKLFSFYRTIISSIAFYPSLILAIFIIIAFLFLSIDKSVSTFLRDTAPFLLIDDAESGRIILTTLIGGIISLMVFSFSMVMVLLNQASSNFSPRLLPGLISNRNNQSVLGFYLGTIVYNIIVTIGISPYGEDNTINGFSILIGIILGVGCLGMFIFFIHTISTNIQINNILERIFLTTKDRLRLLIDQERQNEDKLKVNDSSWKIIRSSRSGYFQGVNLNGIMELSEEYGINIKVLPFKGKHLLPNMNVMKIDRSLDDEKVKILKEYIIYSSTEDISDNYVLGIKQITEVGIKAMSPGINDPGTALITLDYLTELFSLRMEVDEYEIYKKVGGESLVQLATVSFSNLMYNCLAAYRQYCKHDLLIMEKIIYMLKYLRRQKAEVDSYLKVIDQQLNIVREDCRLNIENSTDKDRILQLLD